MANRGPKFGQYGQKANQFWTLTHISIHTKFELDCLNTFWDGWKPPFSVIFWPLDGQWPKSKSLLDTYPISAHTKFELDYVNTFWDNDRKPPFWPIFSHFLATRGPKLRQRHPKSESVLNTRQTNAYIKFEMNWVMTFPDNGRKSQRDGRTDGWMHGRTHTQTDAHHSSIPSRLRQQGQ